MQELEGRNSRRRKGSSAMECSARWLVGTGRQHTAGDIYENMTFKNGKLYRNSRYTITYQQFLGRMARSSDLFNIDRTQGALMFSCTQESYDRYFHDFRRKKFE